MNPGCVPGNNVHGARRTNFIAGPRPNANLTPSLKGLGLSIGLFIYDRLTQTLKPQPQPLPPKMEGRKLRTRLRPVC